TRERVARLAIGARYVPDATALAERGVLGADARIVEPRRHGVRLAYLPLFVLQHERARAVQDADASANDGCGMLAGRDPFPTRLDADKLDTRIIDERAEDPDGVRS